MEIITTARVTRLAIIIAAPGLVVQLGAAPPRAPVDRQTVPLGHIASVATTFGPTITLSGGGSVTVSVGAIASTTIAYGPTLSTGGATVSVGAIASSAVAFGPSVSAGSVIVVVGAIPSSATTFGPTIAAPAPVIDTIVIEGDSLTGAATVGADSGSWAWMYQSAVPTGKSAPVRARGSRYTGLPSDLDNGSNTLYGHLTEDVTTFGGQIIWAGPFLTNDFASGAFGLAGTERAMNIRAALAGYWAKVKERGAKFAFGLCPPLGTDRNFDTYDEFMATRTAFLSGLRNPDVWQLFCDYYIPTGELPDLNLVDNMAFFTVGDSVHPNTLGQTKIYAQNRPAIDTLFDITRATATAPDAAVWPANETGLATSTQIVRTVHVKGIAHKGLDLGASVSGGGAQISLNGGAWVTVVGTGSSNGYRIYNGDQIDLRLTTEAGNSALTTVNLTIGSETRAITYRTTADVSPVTYSHTDVIAGGEPGNQHVFPNVNFASPGIAVIAIAGRNVTSVTLGGQAMTPRFAQSNDASLSLFSLPITSGGAKTIVVNLSQFAGVSAVSAGVVVNADPVIEVVGSSPGFQSAPHETDNAAIVSGGMLLSFFAEYGGASATPGTANGGNVTIDEGNAVFNGELIGVIVGRRTSTGKASFNFGFGSYARGALAFKPLGG